MNQTPHHLHFDVEPSQSHICQSSHKGDWIIFTCPKCKGYERRINWQTGEMKTKNGNTPFSHTGQHSPKILEEGSLNLN